ncbi:MAG: glycosyltransferase family 4 protein [Chloroflexi bacterium]|nr:glycosyltransferase family 4 protein [Chloroflexota bacterium]
MKIGVLTHNYPRFAGDFSGNFIQQLCEELARQGEKVHVIAPYDPAYAPATLSGSNPRLHLYRYAWPQSAHKLGYMRTMQADVRMKLNAYVLSPALFLRGIQTTLRVAQKQQLDILHAHWALPNGFIAAVVARRLRLPLVVSIPGSDALVAGQNPLFRRMVRFAFDQADLITANSRALKKVAVERLGADPAKFDLVIYGVDPNRFTPNPAGADELRARLGIPKDAFLFLAVGRMVYKKGFDVLLQALAEIRRETEERARIHTIMVGEGDLWKQWQEMARQLGIENIHWVGNIATREMGVYYNAADALVMPNVNRPATGLGVTVLDAMACGKPIIGSDTAGNPLVVEPGVNGFIVPEGDASALASAMLELARHPQRAREMGRASRRLIETRFGWPHIVRHYRARFRELVR